MGELEERPGSLDNLVGGKEEEEEDLCSGIVTVE